MSNVKVNGNTYNNVTSVKLALADGAGYATYAEGAVTSDITNDILDGSISGDYTNADILAINLGCFKKCTVGTLNFQNAIRMMNSAERLNAENVLLPKVSTIDTANVPNFRSANISGVLDLSGLVSSITGMNQTFFGATIGTLKIGKMPHHNGAFQTATITNLIWNNSALTASDMAGRNGLGCTGASITNAYVPDSLYDEIQALIAAGTLTTVTNLYKVSEWSDA